jgi:CO dehydrogenase/acetyl-CoA synthase beta subunit
VDNLPELRKIIEKAKLEIIDYKIWNHKDNLPLDLTNLPLKVGSHAWRGVLLEEETQLRLGNSKNPTVLSVICQNNSNGIHHGRITLIGPDLGSIHNKENLFGLIVIIGGSKINSENVNRLRSTIYISDQIEEFELGSNLKQRRFKIGKGIYNRGISFEHIGEAIIKLFLDYHKDLIESIEIIIITKGESLVKDLLEIDKIVQKDYIESMKTKINKYAKQRDDCDFDWECKTCDYQHVCDEIRQIMAERNKNLKGNN